MQHHKSILIIFFTLISFANLYSQIEWINPKPAPFVPQGIFFSDSLYGWMVGGGNTILKTTDGGSSWLRQTPPRNSYLSKVYFLDRNTGWIIGGGGATQGGVFKTTDGGNTWIDVDQQKKEPYYSYNDMCILSPNLAYLGGFNGVIKTTDGGSTWLQAGGSGWTTSVFFLDSLTGWYTNSLGFIYKTADGGKSWVQQTELKNRWHNRIRFADEKNGWVISNGLYSNDASIYKTTNGGSSWIKQDSMAGRHYNDLEVVDSLNAWIAGDNGIVLYTTDGGNMWLFSAPNPLSRYSIQNYFDFAFQGKTTHWVVGGDINEPFPLMFSDTYKYGNPWELRSANMTVNDLRAIEFFDKLNGWMAGDHGALFNTTDGGNIWNPVGLFQIDFSSVSLPEEGVIFLAGKDGQLIRTFDNGKSWTISKVQGAFSSHKIKFFSASTGYSVTDFRGLMKTTDSGNTWNRIENKNATDFFFYDSLNGWITVGPEGVDIPPVSYLYHTTDGGLSWIDNVRIDGSVESMFFLNKNTGWMRANLGLYKTTDGGKTWDTIRKYYMPILYGKQMMFFNDREGYVLQASMGQGDNLFHTTDGGYEFTQVKFSGAPDYFFYSKAGYMWTVGNYGQVYRFMHIPSGVTAPGQSVLINDYSLKQNYPNPFNPATNIEFEIPKAGYVSIKVFSLLGQEVAQILNEYRQAGHHIIRFDASHLPSGIYIYKLTSGSYSTSRKMMLIK